MFENKKLIVFELDRVLWETEESVFARMPPFEQISPLVVRDAKGKLITLYPGVVKTFRWLISRRKSIAISRYYREDLVMDILGKFNLSDLLVSLDVEWDNEKNLFSKVFYRNGKKVKSSSDCLCGH